MTARNSIRMFNLLMLLGLLALALTGASPASASVLVGDQAIEPTTDQNGSAPQAWSYTASTSGTATSIGAYVNSGAASTIQLGLYSNRNGKPYRLLDKATISSPQTGAWNTGTLAAHKTLTAGTKYWLAWLGTDTFRDNQNGTGCTWALSNQTSLASTFNTSQTGTGFCPASFYVSNGTSPAPSAPVNTSPPTISGTAQVGQTLTASPGTWTGNPAPTFTYLWSDGTTGRTDTLPASDQGQSVTVTVTGSNSTGSSSATSQPVGPVQAAPPPPPPPPPSGTCDLNADTTNFATQFAALQGGQTLCLASGNYGTFNGGQKSSRVTIQPQTGASVTFGDLEWNSSTNITLTGVTIGFALVQGNSHDLTIANSTISPDILELVTDQFNQANILIDHDTFPGQVDSSYGRGRVWTTYSTTNTSNLIGVTVQNSLFTGGEMIDVLSEGGDGLQILNNEFTGIDNSISPTFHSDNIFNYGTSRLVMKGNWFHDNVDVPSCSWAEWDGGHDNVFENNVVSHRGGPTGSDGCYESLAAYDDHNSLIAHNVFEPGNGEVGTRLGNIQVGGKTSEGAGSGTVIRDNSMSSIDNGAGGLNATYFEDHNLCSASCSTTGDQGTSAGDILGAPTWTGGTAPTTFNGFALAPGSLGIGGASDGTNIGIELPTGS